MKIDRQKVHDKFGGRCGYCGRIITVKEMQVDHMTPQWMKQPSMNDMKNLMPSCRSCNHYKRGETVKGFRVTMQTLHQRIEKIYINKVGMNFGMMEIKPFDGVFYFEKQ